MEFDAFLSYNRHDKQMVKSIAEALTKSRLKVWFDDWQLIPGGPWQDGMSEGLQKSKTVIVLIGPAGVGRWEEPEIRVAIDESVQRNIPVIPVLLPGVSTSQIENQPFLRQYTWIDFNEGLDDPTMLKRLIWGITGRNPYTEPDTAEPSIKIQESGFDPVSDAVKYLTERSQSTNITFVLGKNFFNSGVTGSLSARMSRELLTSLGLIGADYDQLVPPLDLSASYYATRWDESRLESQMAELLMPQDAQVPAVYGALARLLVTLRNRPARRMRSPVEQMVVTTNNDTWLERALLCAGISFSRVVHFRSRCRLLVNQYRNVVMSDKGIVRSEAADGTSITTDVNNTEDFDKLIRSQDEQVFDIGEVGPDAQPVSLLSFSKLQQPIIYKLLGSYDVPFSCAISTDQHYDLTWQVSRFNSIPSKIGEIISNSPTMFMGCGILDSDFRISYYTVLRNAFVMKSHKRYALLACADLDNHDAAHKMEMTSCESLRNTALSAYGIELLNIGILPFIDMLRDSITAQLRNVT